MTIALFRFDQRVDGRIALDLSHEIFAGSLSTTATVATGRWIDGSRTLRYHKVFIATTKGNFTFAYETRSLAKQGRRAR